MFRMGIGFYVFAKIPFVHSFIADSGFSQVSFEMSIGGI